MSRFVIVCLLASLSGCAAEVPVKPADVPPPRPPFAGRATPEQIKAAAAANNAFAADMHRALAAKGGNLVFSPYSIATALNMTAAGAKGATRDEFAKVLRHPADYDAPEADGALVRSLKASSGGVELRAANALWGPFAFEKAFAGVCRDRYGAAANKVALAGAEAVVNKWAAGNTNGRITELVAPRTFADDAGVVLTSAASFKGEWRTSFDPRATKEQSFRTPAGSKKVTMMFRRTRMKYAWFGAAVAVELPYKGEALSMVVVVPDEDDGLAKVENTLDPEALAVKLAAPRFSKKLPVVELSLPRFTVVGETIQLKEPLAKLGLARAFAKEADFGDVSDKPIRLASVVHKAVIEVGEKGLPAVVEKDTGEEITTPMKPRYLKVTADRPFLFFIRHVESGAVLFMGRVVSP